MPSGDRSEHLTQATRQAEGLGHRLGSWTTSSQIQGYDVATCSGCNRKINVGPKGAGVGEALRERCASKGNNWHRPQTSGTVGGRLVTIDKHDRDQLVEALGLLALLQKTQVRYCWEDPVPQGTFADLRKAQVREPVWEKLHGQKVRVYRNLHNGLFSVQHKGIVVAHVPAVHLNDAHFVVNEAGRQKVLREKKKNVHAFVVGTIDHNVERGVQELPTAVTYNPYGHKPEEKGYFVRRHDKAPITKAKSVTLRLLDTEKDGKPVKVAAMTALEDAAGQTPAEDHRHGLPGA
mgnify:CR=1 FL=1